MGLVRLDRISDRYPGATQVLRWAENRSLDPRVWGFAQSPQSGAL